MQNMITTHPIEKMKKSDLANSELWKITLYYVMKNNSIKGENRPFKEWKENKSPADQMRKGTQYKIKNHLIKSEIRAESLFNELGGT